MGFLLTSRDNQLVSCGLCFEHELIELRYSACLLPIDSLQFNIQSLGFHDLTKVGGVGAIM